MRLEENHGFVAIIQPGFWASFEKCTKSTYWFILPVCLAPRMNNRPMEVGMSQVADFQKRLCHCSFFGVRPNTLESAFCDPTSSNVLHTKSKVDISGVFILVAQNAVVDFEFCAKQCFLGVPGQHSDTIPKPTPMKPLRRLQNTLQSVAILLFNGASLVCRSCTRYTIFCPK
jgi:hypothetical protein